jgi:isopenicillin N synthase-like dioxygenase
MANLLASIHQLSAHALGLPVDFFDQHYKEPLNALKLSNYLPLAQRDNGERLADDAASFSTNNV